MNKKVLIIVLLVVVLLAGGTYFVLKQTGVLADSATVTTIDPNSDQINLLSIDTGAELVNQNSEVTFNIQFNDISTWPGYSETGTQTYVLAGNVFDGDSNDGKTINKGQYNFVQYLTPYYSSDNKAWGDNEKIRAIDSNGGKHKWARPITALTKKFRGVENLQYQIKTTVPSSVNPVDGKLKTTFDVYQCTSNLNYDLLHHSTGRAGWHCGITPEGYTYNSKKIASSNTIEQTIVSQPLADLYLNKAFVFNPGDGNGEPQLFTNPTGDQKSNGYMALTYENKGAGYSPLTYLDLAIGKDLVGNKILDIENIYYVNPDDRSELQTKLGGSYYNYYDAFNVTADNIKKYADEGSVELRNSRGGTNAKRAWIEWSSETLIEIFNEPNQLNMSYTITEASEYNTYSVNLGNLDAGKRGIIVVKFKSLLPEKPINGSWDAPVKPTLIGLMTNSRTSVSSDIDLTNNTLNINGNNALNYKVHFFGATANITTGVPGQTSVPAGIAGD